MAATIDSKVTIYSNFYVRGSKPKTALANIIIIAVKYFFKYTFDHE